MEIFAVIYCTVALGFTWFGVYLCCKAQKHTAGYASDCHVFSNNCRSSEDKMGDQFHAFRVLVTEIRQLHARVKGYATETAGNAELAGHEADRAQRILDAMETEVRKVEHIRLCVQESARVARDCVEVAHDKNQHFAGVILQAVEKIEAIRDEAAHASITALGAAEKAGNIAGEMAVELETFRKLFPHYEPEEMDLPEPQDPAFSPGAIMRELFPGLLETMRQYSENGARVVQDPPCPPETFTLEEIREAIRRARIIRVK